MSNGGEVVDNDDIYVVIEGLNSITELIQPLKERRTFDQSAVGKEIQSDQLDQSLHLEDIPVADPFVVFQNNHEEDVAKLAKIRKRGKKEVKDDLVEEKERRQEQKEATQEKVEGEREKEKKEEKEEQKEDEESVEKEEYEKIDIKDGSPNQSPDKFEVDLISYLLEDCQEKIELLKRKVTFMENDIEIQRRMLEEKQEAHEQDCNRKLDRMLILLNNQEEDAPSTFCQLEHRQHSASDFKMTEIKSGSYQGDDQLIEQIKVIIKEMKLKIKGTYEVKPSQTGTTEKMPEEEKDGYTVVEKIGVILIVDKSENQGGNGENCKSQESDRESMEGSKVGSNEYLFVETEAQAELICTPSSSDAARIV